MGDRYYGHQLVNTAVTSEKEFYETSGVYAPVFRELDALIRKTAPHLKPELFQSAKLTMMAYGVTPYRYASGRTGKWPLIALAPQKNYAALYICAVTDKGYYADVNKDRLGKVSCGKSCIRFKKAEDLNLKVVEEIISDIATRYDKGEVLFGM